MDRTMIEDALFPDCPIRNILARLCDKWSLLVIYTLNKADKETIRFKELQREIPDISQKMLTVTLRTLEDDGYVTRTVYPEVPPRVEYALTERTHSLLPHINALIEWALENKDAIIKDRRKANKEKLSTKEDAIQDTLEIAIEMIERGYTFSNISLEKSDASNFVCDHENKCLIPPFKTIEGLGENAASSIIEARNEAPFTSKEDLLRRTKLNNTNVERLAAMHVLDNLPESEQLSLFDFSF